MSAWQASAPHHGPGRDNKVGREETLGMLAAVEAWVKRDHDGGVEDVALAGSTPSPSASRPSPA